MHIYVKCNTKQCSLTESTLSIPTLTNILNKKIPGVYSCFLSLIGLSVFIQVSENGEKKLDDIY